MSFIKQIVHTIHLIGFAFLLGNLIMDNVFGRREINKDHLPLLSKLYSLSWISLIVTGVMQIVLISKQFHYVHNSKFGTWIKILLLKTALTITTAFFIEGLIKMLVPEEKRRMSIKYARIGMFCVLFFISGFSRDYRETKLTVKTKKPEQKTEEKKTQ